MSRDVSAYRELSETDDPAVVREVRGIDPLLPATWEASIALAPDPEAALELAEQGLALHPHYTPLLVMRLQLLAVQGRTEELIQAARQSLAIGQPGLNQALLHQALVDAQLQSDNPDAALDEVLIFGSLSEAPRPRVAELLARVALSYAVVGRQTDADDTFDESLAVGTSGPARLLNDVARMPARRAAAHDLVERALQRHPYDPDLQLYLAVESIENGDLARARTGLEALPPDLPARLETQVDMLTARLDLLQDRPAEALAAVLPRLDRNPADPLALMVLIELRQLYEMPGETEFRQRLTRASDRPQGLPLELLEHIRQLLASSEPAAP